MSTFNIDSTNVINYDEATLLEAGIVTSQIPNWNPICTLYPDGSLEIEVGYIEYCPGLYLGKYSTPTILPSLRNHAYSIAVEQLRQFQQNLQTSTCSQVFTPSTDAHYIFEASIELKLSRQDTHRVPLRFKDSLLDDPVGVARGIVTQGSEYFNIHLTEFCVLLNHLELDTGDNIYTAVIDWAKSMLDVQENELAGREYSSVSQAVAEQYHASRGGCDVA